MVFDEHWQKVRNANPKLADDHFARALAEAAWEAARAAACAEIKAADDKASEGDYMLDSDDCISVIRGTWRGDS